MFYLVPLEGEMYIVHDIVSRVLTKEEMEIIEGTPFEDLQEVLRSVW